MSQAIIGPTACRASERAGPALRVPRIRPSGPAPRVAVRALSASGPRRSAEVGFQTDHPAGRAFAMRYPPGVAYYNSRFLSRGSQPIPGSR